MLLWTIYNSRGSSEILPDKSNGVPMIYSAWCKATCPLLLPIVARCLNPPEEDVKHDFTLWSLQGSAKSLNGKQKDVPSGKGKPSKAVPVPTPKSATPGKKKSACIGQDYEDDLSGSSPTGRRARR